VGTVQRIPNRGWKVAALDNWIDWLYMTGKWLTSQCTYWPQHQHCRQVVLSHKHTPCITPFARSSHRRACISKSSVMRVLHSRVPVSGLSGVPDSHKSRGMPIFGMPGVHWILKNDQSGVAIRSRNRQFEINTYLFRRNTTWCSKERLTVLWHLWLGGRNDLWPVKIPFH